MSLCLQNMYNFDQHIENVYTFEASDDLTTEENERLRQVCILIINVPRSTKRLDLIKPQLESLKLNTFIFKAVDAADLIVHDTFKQEIKIIEYNKNYFMADYTRRFDYIYRGDIPKGMIGCILSHLLIYNMIQFERTFNHYLILEDDAIVLHNPEKIRKYLANIPESYEMIYLNSESKWFPIINTTDVNDYYTKIQRRHFNASVSYMLSKQGAAKLLAYSRCDVTRPPDDLLSNLHSLGGYNVLAPKEFLFGNNYALESDCERFSKIDGSSTQDVQNENI